MDTSSIESWFSENGALLLLVAIGLLILYILSGRFVHRAVRRTLRATDRDMQDRERELGMHFGPSSAPAPEDDGPDATASPTPADGPT